MANFDVEVRFNFSVAFVVVTDENGKVLAAISTSKLNIVYVNEGDRSHCNIISFQTCYLPWFNAFL
jgi:hypothetical protein